MNPDESEFADLGSEKQVEGTADMAQATAASVTPPVATDREADEDEDVFYDAHEDTRASVSVPATSTLDPLDLSGISAYSMCDLSDDDDNDRADHEAGAHSLDLPEEFVLIDHDALNRLLLTQANATSQVLSFLDIPTLFEVCRVSRHLHRAVNDPRVWTRHFDLMIKQQPELLTAWFVRDGTWPHVNDGDAHVHMWLPTDLRRMN
jgi:hypothetical protein